MTTLTTRIAHRAIQAIRLKRRLSRLAEVENDPAAFARRLKGLRRTDRRRPPMRIRVSWKVERITVSGVDLYSLSRRRTQSRRTLLYLHGGGYLFGPFSTEWAAMRKVAQRSLSDVAFLLYPRAPEHDAETTLGATRMAFDLLADRYGAEGVIPIGTSAGGGLAIALLMSLGADGQEIPPCAVPLSPGVDMTLVNPVGHLEESDLILSSAHVRSAGRVYAGNLKPDDPIVSPLFGNLGGLPRLHVFVGSDELLRPSIEAFARRADEFGAEVHLILGSGQQHTWPIAPTPEGRQALGQVVHILATRCP